MFRFRQIGRVGNDFLQHHILRSSRGQLFFRNYSDQKVDNKLSQIQQFMEKALYHRAQPLLQQLLTVEHSQEYEILSKHQQAELNLWYGQVLSNGSLEAYKEAKTFFQKALTLEPDNREIREAAEGYDASLIPGKDGLLLQRFTK